MAGWKSWQSGEVVLADDFQEYVQNQVVQVYADSTARSEAVGAQLIEGMVSYLQNVDSLEYYAGTATGWLSVNAGIIEPAQISGTAVTRADTGTVTNAMLAGSIENAKLVNSQVTINGVAIALGGSANVVPGGGTADFTNPMTILGDLIVAGTGGVAERLGIGPADTFLFSNGTVASWNTMGTVSYATTSGTAENFSGNVAPNQITAGTFNAGNFTFGSALAVTGTTTLGVATTSNTATTGTAIRNVTFSTADPSGGADGDIWLKYTA
jgi:hypothetical protein